LRRLFKYFKIKVRRKSL